MFAKLMLLFTVVPAVELYLLIKLGSVIGAFETVLIILVTGSIGAFMAKREGLGVLKALKEESLMGIPPGDRIVEGLMVLVGAALLITPGVLTDVTGFVLIMGPSRRLMAPIIKRWAVNKLLSGEGSVSASVMGADVHVGAPRTRDPLRRPGVDRDPREAGARDGAGPGAFSHPTPESD